MTFGTLSMKPASAKLPRRPHPSEYNLESGELNQAYLRDLLSYCPDTGKWSWRVWAGHYRFPPGTPAGHVDNKTGRRVIVIDGKTWQAHRLAVLYQTGEFPGGVVMRRNYQR